MKICHVNFSFLIGGTENLLIDILNEQSREHKVSLIIVNKAYNGKMLRRVSDRVDIILINRLRGDKWNILNILKLWLVILKINPAIIHCHTHKLVNLLFPFKRKCLYTIHNMNIPLNYLSRYRRLFSISKAVKLDLKERGQFESTLVYNGINFLSFSKRNGYSLGNVLRIVQIGRLVHEQKGQDLLIEAMRSLIYEYNVKNIRLEMIGEGPSREYLQKIIIEYGLQEFVVLVGAKDRTWIYENLCHYHLLVQPSYCEGFGLTVVEGVAAGLPVIASDIDGISEILTNAPSARLFDPKNAQDLTLTLRKTVMAYNNDNTGVKERCDQTYQQFKNKFSVVATAENYLEQYTTLE